MFPYSPSHAAHLLFGVGVRNNATGSSQNDAKKRSEFVKFLDISEYFFISHPASGQKEGREQQRLMFFSPSIETISKQIEISGMAEAIVNFTSSLPFQEQQQETIPANPNESEYRYVTSANSKEVILALEKGAFIIGTSLNRRLSKEHDYALHPATIRSILERAYHAYKLFFGNFDELFGRDRDFFKCNLERFFTPYLQLLRLNKTPLVDLFNGVDFLPLESWNFLEVHCLMTNCMEEFPAIKMTMFLYQERLVQYSVEKCDLIPLWHFLNQTLIPAAMLAELSPLGGRRNSIQNGEQRKGFLVDGSILVDFLGEFSLQQFPRVFISDETGEYAAYDLIAYRVLNATACFFIPSAATNQSQSNSNSNEGSTSSPIQTTFPEQLAEFLDAPMSTIASKIGDKFFVADSSSMRPFPSDFLYQFIYFNPDSLSLKKSFPTSIMSARNVGIGSGDSQSPQILPSSMYRLIYETYDKFVADQSMLGQIFLKADNEWWIVFKRVERRILALFLPQNAATTIADVQHCVDGILKTRFPNLFIST